MALERHPLRLRSRTIGQYRIGPRSAELVAEIEPRGLISYEYLLEVRDTEGALELVVSAEVSDLATRCIGVFSGEGHANYPEQERIVHAAEFKERAFELVREWLEIEAPPLAAFEDLGPNRTDHVEPVRDLGRLVVPIKSEAHPDPQDRGGEERDDDG